MNIPKRTIVSAALVVTVGAGGLMLARPWVNRQPATNPTPTAQIVAEAPALPLSPSLPQPGAEPQPKPPATTVVEQAPADANAGPAPTAPVAPSQGPAETRPSELPNRGDSPSRLASQSLNTWVLDAIDGYQGGSYPYLLNTDYANYNGVTRNISYKNSIIAKAHPSGNRASHCTGITFEVFFKAMQARNRELGISIDDFNGMSANDLRSFMQLWYVAGPKSSNNLAIAVERYGIGTRIYNLSDAKPGDFIDFSRSNGTGHAAVLINWVWQNGEIVGFKYWSSQGSTDGISYNTEYFTPKGSVLKSPVYIARVGSISDYK